MEGTCRDGQPTQKLPSSTSQTPIKMSMFTGSHIFWIGMGLSAVILAAFAVLMMLLVKRHRRMKARERLRKQMVTPGGLSRPSPPLYNHPQFTMMHSSSIPFIPVAVAPSQAKIYDLKTPPTAHLYRTPSQSMRHPKFSVVNGSQPATGVMSR